MTEISAEEMKPPAEERPRRNRFLERTSLVVIILGWCGLTLAVNGIQSGVQQVVGRVRPG